jgi:hypothetical protein
MRPQAARAATSTMTIPLAPLDRGRLLSAEQVASELFNGTVTARWVTRNVRVGKLKLGHIKRAWWENQVRAWLQSLPQEE